jgi:hypothetical protein
MKVVRRLIGLGDEGCAQAHIGFVADGNFWLVQILLKPEWACDQLQFHAVLQLSRHPLPSRPLCSHFQCSFESGKYSVQNRILDL